MIQILNLGSTIGVVKNGVLTGYNLSGIESVTWEKDAEGYVVKITFLADNGCATEALFIPLRDVSNMPSWTDDVPGSNQAVSDILSWITSGTSTPAVLDSILTTLQAFTEYEAVYVKDATGAVLLEVRVWNADTSTWSTSPVYYAPGSNVAVTPTAPLQYLDSTTTLATWYSLYQNGLAKTTSIARPTTSGTITAGKNSASIANVGAANGTVKGVVLKPNETLNFDAGGVNNTLDAIAYNATGTEFLIITVE